MSSCVEAEEIYVAADMPSDTLPTSVATARKRSTCKRLVCAPEGVKLYSRSNASRPPLETDTILYHGLLIPSLRGISTEVVLFSSARVKFRKSAVSEPLDFRI